MGIKCMGKGSLLFMRVGHLEMGKGRVQVEG